MERYQAFPNRNSFADILQCERKNHVSCILSAVDPDRFSLCRLRNDKGCAVYPDRQICKRNAAQSCSAIVDYIFVLVFCKQVSKRGVQEKHNLVAGIGMCCHTCGLCIQDAAFFSGRSANGIL